MTNTQIVKSMYDAFSRGDIAAILNSLADDAEWVAPGPSTLPTAGQYHGKAGVAAFFQKVGETTDFDRFTVEQYVEQGDVVVALGFYSGRSKPMQKPFESKWAMVFTLRGGKVARFEEFNDTAALVRAYEPAASSART